MTRTQARDGSIHVLYVEDDPDFAETAATFLEREDSRFDIETATSADEGLGRLDDGRFECVVSDYDMPGMDGIEFLRAVRDEHPDLPFVLFTGKGSEEVASEAVSAGVTDYLQKESGTDQYTILANRITNAVSARWAAAEADQTRRELEQILKTVPACIVRLNREGEFVFANERAVEVLGLERSDVTERTYNDPEWDIRDLDGDPIPDEELPFRQVRDSGEPLYGYRHTIEWPDGTRKVLLVNGAPLFDDRGNVEHAVFALSDITDTIEHETRLRHTTARLEALFEDSPDMINVHDGDGKITDCNARLCEETGYDEDELVGMDVWDIDRTIEPGEARARWAGMDTGDRLEVEGVYQRRDGSTFPVKVHIRRLDRDEGDRFVVISRDISEQKDRERELERANELLSTLFETLPAGVAILDADGRITGANQRAEEVLGLDESEIIDRTYDDPQWRIVDADGNPIPDEDLPFARVMETGEPVFDREHGIEWPDGTERWLSINAAPLTTESDEVGSVVAVISDITDQRNHERAIERQNEQLEEFTRVVSHDLRNPLNVARARLELAREDCDSAHLDDVARAHERMNDLIDDLLTLARDGTRVSDTEPVDLAGLVENCWRNVETADATIRASVERSVRADRSQLAQLLENLIRNAVEHGGGDVTITVGEFEDGFYVEDDGPGIPEDERDEVFDAGYSTARGGTGFGLSIVEQVADAHGWDVRVTDGAGGGARFEITGVESAE